MGEAELAFCSWFCAWPGAFCCLPRSAQASLPVFIWWFPFIAERVLSDST